MKIDGMAVYVRTWNALNKLGFKTAGEVIDAAMTGYDCIYNQFTLRQGLMRLCGVGPAIADDFLRCLELPNH